MEFARRVANIDLSGIRKIFEAAGSGAINLGLGQPDFDTPEHIKEAAIQAIRDGFTKYTHNVGELPLREAICEKFKCDNDIEVKLDEIIVTAGASEALHLALEALVGPGDEVLIPDPSFVSYAALTKVAGATPVYIPLDDNLHLQADIISEYITPNTKVLVMNSPSNPTGAVQTAEEIEAIADLASERGLVIISDEVYEHFIYEGEHFSPANFYDGIITINATSKTYAMTGWRLGYLSAPKNYVEQMLKIHQYCQACACSISQRAAYAALTGPQDSVAKMRDAFRERRELLLTGLKDLNIDCIKPAGAFYVFPEVENEMDKVNKLLARGVITVPGTAFGEEGRGHIRLSYATSADNIKKALEIMAEVLS